MGLLAALLSVLLAVTALGEEVLWPGKGPGAAEESIRWTEGRLPEDGAAAPVSLGTETRFGENGEAPLTLGEGTETREGKAGTLTFRVTSKKKRNRPTWAPAQTAAPTKTPAPGEAAKTPAVTAAPAGRPAFAEEDGPIIKPQAIADYLFMYGELPPNFITKREAQALGWDSSWNYVSDVAPGKSIGGDRFGNYEGRLPQVWGIQFIEADANYVSGRRRAERIIYSSEGRVWYTGDHYRTFQELFPSWEQGNGKQ